MKFGPINIKLKTGEPVTIREAKESDADSLIKTIKKYIGESEFIPYTEEEYVLKEEDSIKWIHSFLNSENNLLLVATHNNTIIGNIDITASNRSMLRHTAVLGVGMIKDWTNKGLGSAFLDAAINWVKKILI